MKSAKGGKLRDFGFHEGINEIIAVTLDDKGKVNTAPIGIIVDDADGVEARATLYKSHTRENIEKGSNLYANVVMDPLIFAISAFEDLGEEHFRSVKPPVLHEAVAWCEFSANLKGVRVYLELTDGEFFRDKMTLRAVNRGFNAVIEGLVHATRYLAVRDGDWREELKEKILYYKKIVERCGGKREKEAYQIIIEKTGLKEI